MNPEPNPIDITGVFILPKDVVLVKVASLPLNDRHRLEADEGDFVITRIHGRTASKVVDAAVANLLERLREGNTIVDAVLAFASENKIDPEEAMDGAYPIISRLIQDKFLVNKKSADAVSFSPSQHAGDECDGLIVVEVVQALEDSELYRACTANGEDVALKITRSEAGGQLSGAMYREAGILKHLNGGIAPRLVKAGIWEERPYVATSWCKGLRADQASARLRSLAGPSRRQRLLDLCCCIVDAYATLHQRGVIHGDVHPGNLIVEDDQSVKIIDFGYSRLTTSDDERLARARRVGVGYFFEPEYARARAGGQEEPPPTSFLGEQHIVAHLLYWLVTGHSIAKFSADHKIGMAQLVDGVPWPFALWAIEPWPDLEQVLARALSIDAQQRFDSVADFAVALKAVKVAEPVASDYPPRETVALTQSLALLDDYLRRFDPAGILFESTFPESPRCSMYFGGGGIAYFLYRLGCIREDARLLTWAKLWIEKAVADVGPAGGYAFHIPEGTISYDVLGPISPYHTMSGLRAIQTLIAKAQGDITTQVEGVTAFIEAVEAPWENIDLTLGRSGVLLGCSLLSEALPFEQRLRSIGDATLAGIWAIIETKPDIAQDLSIGFTGIAHGWAGILYSVMSWCRATNHPLPESLAARLNQLADLAEEHGRAVRWRRIVKEKDHKAQGDYWPSWCNGTSGMIFLWTLAHEMCGEPRYLDLAKRAAMHALDQPETVDQICCGRPGQAFGVLNLYKHTGESSWLEFAKELVEQSLARTPPLGPAEPLPSFYYSLFKGPMGLALLSADIRADPLRTAMPFFESEGWGEGETPSATGQ